MTSSRGLQLITRLHELTAEMVLHKEDIDTVIAHLDERQKIMDEFDLLREGGKNPFDSDEERNQADTLMRDIVDMNETISSVLLQERDDIKSKLSASKNNQAVLKYTNYGLSGSGSYMDYKK